MKKIIIITFLLMTAFISNNFAQKKGEETKALRIAIYTEELKLTSDEAQVFWPIFNEYSQKQMIIKTEQKLERQKLELKETLSNTEAEKAIELMFSYDQKELDLKKEYTSKLLKVISPQKVLLIPKAETRFKKALLEQIKEK